MNNLSNYFNQAQDEANDSFTNYDGGFEDDMNFAGDDEFDGFDGDGADAFDMASGGTMSAPTSQPYIVVIKNTNTATAFPVTVLGAYNTLSTTSPNYQNSASISITMGISGITYGISLSNNEQAIRSRFNLLPIGNCFTSFRNFNFDTKGCKWK